MRTIGGIAVFGFLIAAGGGIHAGYAVTDIVDAAKRGDIHAVHRLIENSTENVEDTDDSGFTALHWAGIRGHWRIFSELVAAGAPVNAVGGDGGTPLHWTCHNDNVDAVEQLLSAGANLDVANRWGRTPLHVAARRNCVDVAAMLLDRGADPNAVTKEGWTPLHVAAMSDHPKMAILLISHGSDPDARDGEGRVPTAVARNRPAPIGVDPDRLSDYVGIYDLGGGFSTKVWREGDALRIREFAPDDLYPIAKDSFFCVREPWRVTFLRNDAGTVESVDLEFLRRTVRGAKTSSPQYVGAAACMDCHNGNERSRPAITWMQSRHGHAYWRLGSNWALFLARLRPHYADLTSPIADHRCLLCHVTGRQNDNALFIASFRNEEGIGCESCHGPGSLYMETEIMADRKAFLANGGTVPGEATCRSCHRQSENFDYAEMLPKIAHGSDPEKH
jgi:hypothetical protein